MHLGILDICMPVKTIKAFTAFYKELGFELKGGTPNP